MRQIRSRLTGFTIVVTAATMVIGFFFLTAVWPGWGYQWGWTGYGPIFDKPNAHGLSDVVGITAYSPSKTLWDWMQLLLVPLAVAGAAGVDIVDG